MNITKPEATGTVGRSANLCTVKAVKKGVMKKITLPQRYGDKAFFRPDEVADILSVSKSMVYRMAKNGEIVVTKKSPVRIPRRALMDYIRFNCQGYTVE
jgi:excisionase family DNA binding protein